MIKLFEEYSRDKLGDIEDVFQSFIDDYDLNVFTYDCEESIIHLKDPIEYYISKDNNPKINTIYRYRPSKDTEWQKAGGSVFMDGKGHETQTSNKTIEDKVEYIKKTNYHCIDIKGSGEQISNQWNEIYQGIRKCVIQLNSLSELSLYSCGDLFFKNGVETNLPYVIDLTFIEIDWVSRKTPYINFYSDARLAICLK